ncbi:mechanosensitive ion channel family protein [Poriferisphaera sp. WC338]|uniref:mechanosensitive ion channel family protein n=1 Tax=Poriferisphaera sp. WC338 TaxID=3425129 RepID=UPI003D814443
MSLMMLAQNAPEAVKIEANQVDLSLQAQSAEVSNNAWSAIQQGDWDKLMEILFPILTQVVLVLLLLFVGYLVAAWAGRAVSGSMRKAKLDETLTRFFGKMTRWAILILVVLAILGKFGISTASFAAVIAAAGLAVGLAFQGTLSNFAAGVMLLVFRPFKVGDVVSVGGTTGKVFEIELFTTTLDTPDNRRFIVPNSSVFGATIENITYHDTRRVDVAVGTDYSADLSKVREVLKTVAEGVEGRLESEDVIIYLVELGGSSIDWSVRVWAKTDDYWAVREALTRDVKNALDAAGIGIPFPQLDVHMDRVEAAQV